jgi:ankyrin repeat protein
MNKIIALLIALAAFAHANTSLGDSLLTALETGKHAQFAKQTKHADTADLNATNQYGETPLIIAAREGNVNAIKAVFATNKFGPAQVKVADVDGNTALMYAATNNDSTATKLLLSHGAYTQDDIEAKNALKQSAIDIAKPNAKISDLLQKAIAAYVDSQKPRLEVITSALPTLSHAH